MLLKFEDMSMIGIFSHTQGFLDLKSIKPHKKIGSDGTETHPVIVLKMLTYIHAFCQLWKER